MSTAELIYEKAKLLSEPEAQSVLKYVVTFKPSALTARELPVCPSPNVRVCSRLRPRTRRHSTASNRKF